MAPLRAAVREAAVGGPAGAPVSAAHLEAEQEIEDAHPQRHAGERRHREQRLNVARHWDIRPGGGITAIHLYEHNQSIKGRAGDPL